MEQVTIALSDETKAALDDVARREYAGSHDDAVQELLEEWFESRS